MKVAICYPYILRRPDLQECFVRFLDTYSEFCPDYECDLKVLVCDPKSEDDSEPAIDELPDHCRLGYYFGGGWDIGAHQHAANTLSLDYDFAVFVGTRTYFHREGWLKHLMSVREPLGIGVYGAMGSLWIRPHIRTCLFACDLSLIRAYPHVIMSRPASLEFESGPTNFVDWCKGRGAEARIVQWDGVYAVEHARVPENTFRKGDQSNCLCFDRHTDAYRDAGAEDKAILEKLANGG